MEGVTLSTNQLEEHGLIDQLGTVVDISQIDRQVYEQDQNDAGSDIRQPEGEEGQEIDVRDELEVSERIH